MTNRIPIFSIYISLQFIPYINFLIYINLNSQQNSLSSPVSRFLYNFHVIINFSYQCVIFLLRFLTWIRMINRVPFFNWSPRFISVERLLMGARHFSRAVTKERARVRFKPDLRQDFRSLLYSRSQSTGCARGR